jgi:hypothetical protein
LQARNNATAVKECINEEMATIGNTIKFPQNVRYYMEVCAVTCI